MREECTSLGPLLLLSGLLWRGRRHWTWVSLCLWVEGRKIQGFTGATAAKGSDHLPASVVEQGLGWPRLSLLSAAANECQPRLWSWVGNLCWASPLLVLWPENRLFRYCLLEMASVRTILTPSLGGKWDIKQNPRTHQIWFFNSRGPQPVQLFSFQSPFTIVGCIHFRIFTCI